MKHFDFLLHLKTWQIALVFIPGYILMKLTFDDNPLLTALQVTFGLVFIFGWLVIIGHRLHHYFPGANGMNYRLFTVSSIMLTLSGAFIIMRLAFPNSTFIKSDVMSILIAILCFVPLLHCAYFSSSMIESIEAKKEVDYEDNLGSFMGMLILPIGIWKFQPMIRKAMESRSQDLTLQV